MTQHDREKWDRKHAEADLYQDVSQVVLAYQAYFPMSGSALDVAGGTAVSYTHLPSPRDRG